MNAAFNEPEKEWTENKPIRIKMRKYSKKRSKVDLDLSVDISGGWED
jgi:hypothetical protein